MPRKSPATVILFGVWLLAASIGAAQPHDDKERTELATALKDARISLEQGVSAGAREGKPISAKYEVDDGKLQHRRPGDRHRVEPLEDAALQVTEEPVGRVRDA